MYPLFETLKVFNGIIQNADWHQQRYEEAYKIYFGKTAISKITDSISIPEECKKGIYKLRISYNENSKKVEFEKYSFKKNETLKIVSNNSIVYHLKYTDRTEIENLLKQKENFDDILIIKNGMVTDTSFCNIVLFDGKNWITPSTPLLKGTTRERLLKSKIIKKKEIRLLDLKNFRSFKLINALRDFETSDEIDIMNIQS